MISEDDFGIKEIKKIKAEINGKELFGLNDIIIRNQLPNSALRFEVSINGEKIGDEFEMDSDTIIYVVGVSLGYKF